ncbi:hypothetical protein BLNAU_7028 [Blattamonas nauphoetae]|uniref:Uncharacterized protein n=1 Tax=Blattamonas nauphoetae TaxID=2049346 RepID=A0ABQ9Y2Z7_9EUKA|nr:hypothetical protein BLNAU_7028 [Blattamonas nauphoetae]
MKNSEGETDHALQSEKPSRLNRSPRDDAPGPSSFNHASFTSDPSLSIHHLPTTFNPIFTILLTENSLTPTSFPVLCCRSLLSVSPHATIGIVVPPTFDLISLQKADDEFVISTNSDRLKLEIASFADRFDPIIIMNTDMIFLKDIIPSVSTFFESQKLIALTHQPISPSSLYHSITHHPDSGNVKHEIHVTHSHQH